MNDERPVVVSLFSGAGGLDLGFRAAGFDIKFAADYSSWAIDTHKHNFPDTSSIVLDLASTPTGEIVKLIRKAVGRDRPLAVIGGPPCQGFSRANVHGNAEDPRNSLPTRYLDIVEALQDEYPVRFVLFENVVGIRDKRHEETFSGILAQFERLGFHTSVDTYKAEEFGVPQKRRRVIISAFDSIEAKTSFSPKTTHAKALTVRDVLEGFPEPTFFRRGLTTVDTHHPNHWTMAPRSDRFSQPDRTVSGTRSFKRLEWDRPSPTVAYGHREIHVHPLGHRRLSIFEAMVLQGFPPSYQLKGPLSAQVEQVSNAVPPPLATALAWATKEALMQSPSPSGGANG